MRIRSVSFLMTVSVSMLLLSGVTGCARKAVKAPPAPAAPPAAAAPREVPATPPAPPAAPTPAVTTGNFVPVFFGFDSYALTDAARATLDQNARLLREQPDVQIVIEGHCDERGTVEYNQALGERRAQAARDYLTAAGVPGTRIQIVSYGKERPFNEGHNEAAWAGNRRAHFVMR